MPDLVRGVPGLDDKIIPAGDPQAGAEYIAHIDELQHLGFERMSIEPYS